MEETNPNYQTEIEKRTTNDSSIENKLINRHKYTEAGIGTNDTKQFHTEYTRNSFAPLEFN